MYNNLIIGASGKLGKYINLPNSMLTYNKKKIKNGYKLNANFKLFKNLYDKYKFKKIILLAGVTDIDKCKLNFKEAKKINVDFPKKIINYIKNKDTKLIFFSTDQIYGNNNNASENSKLNPLNIYSKQKIIIENLIKKKIKNYLILRISRVVLEKDIKGDFISSFLDSVKKSKPILACDDYYFNFIFSSYLSQCFSFLLKNNIKGTVNLAGSKSFSFFEIFYLLKKKLVSIGFDNSKIKLIKIKVDDLNFKETRAKSIYLNTKKISKLFKSPPDSKKYLFKVFKNKIINQKLIK